MFFKQSSLNDQNIPINKSSGYQLSPLKKGTNGQYLFPEIPCGVLPFFINEEYKIVWGCVETDRVGIKVIQPPAGTQDLIIIKEDERFSIEVSKPLPEFNKDFLQNFTGKNVSGHYYQEIINCFITNGYQVFLEHMLTAAMHETQEEHGVDLRMAHNDLLINLYDFESQPVIAKRGTVFQKIYTAHLSDSKNIALKKTDKIEEKILINKDRNFYEKGIWCTMEELQASFENENLLFLNNENNETGLNIEQKNLKKSALTAWKSRIELIEKIEASMAFCLNIDSKAQATRVKFELMSKEAIRMTENDSDTELNNYNLF